MAPAKGVKRTASRASDSATAKNKRKQAVALEVPKRGKVRCRLYTCGQGDVGQLGLGEDVMETSRFKEVTALGDKIVNACAGGMHTVALDSDGNVWTFGCNDEGALGRATSSGDETSESKPGKVKLPGKVVQISAGDSHSAALLDDGQVYVWGAFRDSHGSMGLMLSGGGEGKSSFVPICLSLPEMAADIASGGDHLCILLRSGVVYTMGCGEQGQLGRLTSRSASRNARHGLNALLVPSVINSKQHFSKLWAGSHATLAQDANTNKIYAWGLNNYNQLGITGAKKKEAIFRPEEADAFTKSSKERNFESINVVSCGQHHTLALDNAGTSYAVGRCEYGRLGLGPDSGDSEQLAVITTLEKSKCNSIAASTSSSFACTLNGELYAWGMGSEGQLGLGTDEDHSVPKLVLSKVFEGKKAYKVSAGGQHTVILLADSLDPIEEEEEPIPEPEEAPAQSVDEPPKKRGRRKEVEPEVASSTADSETEAKVAKRKGRKSTTASAAEKKSGKMSKRKTTVEKKDEPAPMETDEADGAEKTPEKSEAEPEKPESAPEKPEEEPQEDEPMPEKEEPTIEKTEETKPAEIKAAEPEKKSEKDETEKKEEKTVEEPKETEPVEPEPEKVDDEKDITEPHKPEITEKDTEMDSTPVTETKNDVTESIADTPEPANNTTETAKSESEVKEIASESENLSETKEIVEEAAKEIAPEIKEVSSETPMETDEIKSNGDKSTPNIDSNGLPNDTCQKVKSLTDQSGDVGVL